MISGSAARAAGPSNFSRAADLWDASGRESEKPYFGRLTTDLSVYPTTTLSLKTRVHTRPVGEHPCVELEPTDRPLAFEQRTGIGMDRVREIAIPATEIDRTAAFQDRWGGLALPPATFHDGGPRILGADWPEDQQGSLSLVSSGGRPG